MSSESLFIDWRQGEFSDWSCTLGDATFNLHKNVLAAGRRRSGFFKGAFNEGFEAGGTDLAVLLPVSCHAYVELALDFVYGGELTFTIESALALCKIADVLSIESLMESSTAAVSSLYEGTLEQFEAALGLELPTQAVEALLPRTRTEDILEALARRPAEPHLRMLLQACAEKVRVIKGGELDLQPGVQRTDKKEVCLTFSGRQTQRLHKSPIATPWAVCRLRIVNLTGSGPSIGVSKLSADASFCSCLDGGFATKAGCWGLCLDSGNLFAEGAYLEFCGKKALGFSGNVVKMLMDIPKCTLSFTLEDADGSETALCSISGFAAHDDLVFTVCACCKNTQYAVLEMDF